jgi:hypothetical protein
METMQARFELYVRRAIFLGVVGLFLVWPLIAAAVVLTWAIYIASASYYYQGYLGRDLELELGFHHGTYVPRSGLLGPQRMLAIRDVQPDGVFARAGFRDWDLVPLSFTGFFKTLHCHRGRTVELTVIEGNSDLPIFERPRRVIQFVVPLAPRADGAPLM